MGGLMLAWLAAEGIVTWRWAKAKAPPPPGTLLGVSGFFVLLALVAQYPPARSFATLTAVGVNVAALMQVLPGSQKQAATGWPPPLITDGTIILPTGKAHAASQPYGNQPGGSGPGSTVPKGPNTTTPGTPAAPGQGVIFPPGSSNL